LALCDIANLIEVGLEARDELEGGGVAAAPEARDRAAPVDAVARIGFGAPPRSREVLVGRDPAGGRLPDHQLEDPTVPGHVLQRLEPVFERATGSFEDGTATLTTETDDRATLFRETWSPLAADKVLWKRESSTDGGGSWIVVSQVELTKLP